MLHHVVSSWRLGVKIVMLKDRNLIRQRYTLIDQAVMMWRQITALMLLQCDLDSVAVKRRQQRAWQIWREMAAEKYVLDMSFLYSFRRRSFQARHKAFVDWRRAAALSDELEAKVGDLMVRGFQKTLNSHFLLWSAVTIREVYGNVMYRRARHRVLAGKKMSSWVSWRSWALQKQVERQSMRRAQRSACPRFHGRKILIRWRRSLAEDEHEAVHTLPMTEWSSLCAYVAALESQRDAVYSIDLLELGRMDKEKLMECILTLRAENKKLASSGRQVREDNPTGRPEC